MMRRLAKGCWPVDSRMRWENASTSSKSCRFWVEEQEISRGREMLVGTSRLALSDISKSTILNDELLCKIMERLI